MVETTTATSTKNNDSESKEDDQSQASKEKKDDGERPLASTTQQNESKKRITNHRDDEDADDSPRTNPWSNSSSKSGTHSNPLKQAADAKEQLLHCYQVYSFALRKLLLFGDELNHDFIHKKEPSSAKTLQQLQVQSKNVLDQMKMLAKDSFYEKDEQYEWTQRIDWYQIQFQNLWDETNRKQVQYTAQYQQQLQERQAKIAAREAAAVAKDDAPPAWATNATSAASAPPEVPSWANNKTASSATTNEGGGKQEFTSTVAGGIDKAKQAMVQKVAEKLW